MIELQVSKDSWHYRWYQRWQNWKRRTDKTYAWLLQTHDEPQLDLCHYFWIVVLFAPWRWFWQSSYRWDFVRPFTVTGALIAAGGISSLSALFPFVMLKIFLTVTAALFAAIIGVIVVVSLAEYKWHKPIGRAIGRAFGKPLKAEARASSLFKEYIKAKKRKVCPLITVTGLDDSDDDTIKRVKNVHTFSGDVVRR